VSGRVRVGLVGCGEIAAVHAADYYLRDDALAGVVAVADARGELASAMAARCGLPEADAHESVEALLARGDVDVLDVCAPPAAHAAIIRAGVEAGVAVLCEKPLALEYQEVADAVRLAAVRGVAVGVMQNYRWRPEYRLARDMLAGGGLGAVTLASIRGLFHWYGGRPYRLAAERMMFMEMGVHYVDLLQYLIGSDVVSVHAEMGRSAQAPNRGDTFGSATLRYANGAVGHVLVSGECQGRTAYWGGRAIVQAEQATLYINEPEDGTLHGYGPVLGGELRHRFAPEHYTPYTQITFARPLDDCYRTWIDTGTFPVSGAENLKVLATVLACYASAEAHRTVALSEITDAGPGLEPAARRETVNG
jgi:UDP-N-acetyl-2-amino-2-deoxyglucuronate dehydrogenase